jgi:two-component system, sensor histidine kinase
MHEMTPTIVRFRVLVVDDDKDLRDAMMEFLRTLGHKVSGACNAEEALQVAGVEQPEVAFIDMVLPDASGHDVAKRLRALPGDARIRLIALTGLSDRAARRQAMETGFDFFLVKPCPAHRIAALLNSLGPSDAMPRAFQS